MVCRFHHQIVRLKPAAQDLSGANGTITITESAPGQYEYHITCGSGAQIADEEALVTIVTPSVSFNPNTTDLQLGQHLEFRWNSLANSCTTSGGAPSDGWSGAQVAGGGFVTFFPASLGTYTYTLNCVAGKASAQAVATVTVENDPAYATLTVSSHEIAVGQLVTASYKSNIANCILGSNAVGDQPQGIFEDFATGGESQGTITYNGGNVGASQLTFSCGAQGSTPAIVSAIPQTVTVVAAIPKVQASISAPADATSGTPFSLSWETSNAASCSASGGGADGKQWQGPVAIPSGQQAITPNLTGKFTYTLMCVGQIPSDTVTVQATVNVSAPPAPPPPPPPPSGSTGGDSTSGGGGGFDGVSLGVLVMLGAWRTRRTNGRRLTA